MRSQGEQLQVAYSFSNKIIEDIRCVFDDN